MAKSTYKITAIRPGMAKTYHEFWSENKTVSEDGTPLRPQDLAIVDIVEAKNQREAEVLAAKRFPGHSCEVSRVG
ncbi:hypothetical protein [Cupriavidus sp. WS]|uniref:hypothetical protein n=1 Tax=Cupriavidus sp. WS TaxID=1312922 RepID=UPI000380863A|nr:hypothetical protein [Cupriavidus sp. WS]